MLLLGESVLLLSSGSSHTASCVARISFQSSFSRGIHCACLVLIFALLSFALSVEPRLPSSWVRENGPKDTSPFVLVLIFFGAVTPTIQAWRYRRILKLAVEAENITTPN